MALYTSLTGLNGANNDLSVIANNIANVGSTGFKKSAATFADLYATSASQDPRKTVGIGTLFEGARQNFTQGPLQTTGNTLDMAITGGGFFVTRSARGETMLTRNGAFALDPQRYVVGDTGTRLMGFPVNADGIASAVGAAALQPIHVPQTSGAPQASTLIDLGVNLPSAGTVPATVFNPKDPTSFNSSTSTTIYDSLGSPLTATIYYVRTSTPTISTPSSNWDAHLFVGNDELSTSASTPKTPETLTFDNTGTLTAPTSPAAFQPYVPSTGAAALALSVDHGLSTTQTADPFGVVAATQNGFAAGQLDSITIDGAGLIKAGFTNGQTQALGQIAIADVSSPQGLKQLGNANWAQTGASGTLLVGQAGSQGLGTVQSGSLERSNVELTDELVNLIVAQRDFQANAKAVDTDGQMFQSIVQIHG
jgi:flagellar hook protein FlgE